MNVLHIALKVNRKYSQHFDITIKAELKNMQKDHKRPQGIDQHNSRTFCRKGTCFVVKLKTRHHVGTNYNIKWSTNRKSAEIL